MRVQVDLLDEDGDLVIHDGTPFTGTAYELYLNGSLCHEASYKDGLPHGYWRDWYPCGVLKFECECLKGLRHGKTTRWYENGAIFISSEYEYGIETRYLEQSEKGEKRVERAIGPDSPGGNYKLLIQRRAKFG